MTELEGITETDGTETPRPQQHPLDIPGDILVLPQPINRLELFRQSTDGRKFVFFLLINVILGAVVYIIPSGKNFANFNGDKTNWFSDSLYYSSTILTTNGFGDLTPLSAAARVLTSIYIIINFLVMNYAIYGLFSKFVDMIEGPDSTPTRKNGMCLLYCLTTFILGVGLLYCEGLDFGQTIYTIVVAFSSTGLGDFSFSSPKGRVFGALWMLLSHLVLSRIGYLLTSDNTLSETNKTLQKNVANMKQDLLLQKQKFATLQIELNEKTFNLQKEYTDAKDAYMAENKQASELALKMVEAANSSAARVRENAKAASSKADQIISEGLKRIASLEKEYKDAKDAYMRENKQKLEMASKMIEAANNSAASVRENAKAASSKADRIISEGLERIASLEETEAELRREVDSLRSLNSKVSSKFESLEVVARELLIAAEGAIGVAEDVARGLLIAAECAIRVAEDLSSQREANKQELESLKKSCNTKGAEPSRDAREEHVMHPWEVCTNDSGKTDYYQLIDRFGCQNLEPSVTSKIKQLTGHDAHIFLRRGIFFAHRDFNEIIDSYAGGGKFYILLGLGPLSNSMDLGKMIPFIFAKYMQDTFKVPVVIQLTDDEECIWNELKVEESSRVSRESAKDIIACGFDITKTFIFSDFGYIGGAFYGNMVKVAKSVTLKQVEGIFGFTSCDLIGKISFAPVKAVPSFPSSFPHLFSDNNNVRCLIPCSINQDPFYSMIREVAPKIGFDKPALIESLFLPALQGESGKVSANNPSTVVYVTDSFEDIKSKVNGRVFFDGDNLMENQRKYRENNGEDILKYLEFFHEDDHDLEYIKEAYDEGKIQLGGVKVRLIEVLSDFIEKHQKARAAVTDEMVDQYMAVRPLPDMFN